MPSPDTSPEGVPARDVPGRRRRLGRVARVVGAQFRVPGTEFRFGLDALIGLVPGVGDAAGALVSGYIVLEAVRMGASRAVLLQMVANIAVDALVGAFPVLGDLFDAAWKANVRNVDLLEEHLDAPETTAKDSARSNRRMGGLLLGGVALLALGGLALGAGLVWLLVQALGG